MKALLIAICVAGLLLLAGCGDSGGNVGIGNNGNNGAGGGGGNNTTNLQKFVIANCGAVTNGKPVPTNGSSFPANSQTDPTQSVYSKNCLSDVN